VRTHAIGLSRAVTVDDLTVRVRFGPLFRADIPRSAIAAVRVVRPSRWWGVGVHQIRDGWVVNTRLGQAVELRFHEPVRATFVVAPIHPRRLVLGVADPDALVADLGG
jgi:hypothetical protein